MIDINSLGKIIPVIKIDDNSKAVMLANSLEQGGIKCMEITFRTANADGAIAAISQNCPQMIVGAGTIINLVQCKKAIASGAKFIVSPGFDQEVAKYCIDNNILYVGGCITPTEIMTSINMGIDTIKFFPAESFGGLDTIKALAAPFGNIKFIPTGGINLENIAQYLSFKKVIAVGASFICTDQLITSGDFEQITRLAKKAVAIANIN